MHANKHGGPPLRVSAELTAASLSSALEYFISFVILLLDRGPLLQGRCDTLFLLQPRTPRPRPPGLAQPQSPSAVATRSFL